MKYILSLQKEMMKMINKLKSNPPRVTQKQDAELPTFNCLQTKSEVRGSKLA